MRRSKKIKTALKEIIWWVLIIACIIVFVGGAFYVYNHYKNAYETKKMYSNLASSYESVKEESLEEVIVNSGVVEKTHLKECEELYEKNNDLVGWLSIPGMDISYPVMQTSVENRDFYLRRDFYKNYNIYGSVYASEDCDVFTPSDNVILYGHNMRDGTMFGKLLDYQEKKFWSKHQYISFDNLYEHHVYQVVSVFKTSANGSFRYHQFINAESEGAFQNFVNEVKSREFYDTGVELKYGDKLLCLSTCEYTLENGRFVVVAKRIH